MWLEIFFSSKRYQYFYSTLFPVIFVWLCALKGIAKALAMDLLMLNPLGVIKTRILAPKRCDEPPYHFYMGLPLGQSYGTWRHVGLVVSALTSGSSRSEPWLGTVPLLSSQFING